MTPLPSEPVELAPVEAAGSGAGLAALPTGTRRVLEVLKRLGDASAEQISAELDVTVSAVRQQLAPLEDRGLVAHRDERPGGRGRPKRRYCLAPAAESLWPKRYGQLTNQLLGFIAGSDPSLVETAFQLRRQERVARAQSRLDGLGLGEQVVELTAILDEDGYLSDCAQVASDRWLVTEHNCAILDVAQRYGTACGTELAFLREVLPGATVERIAHRLAGAHVCAYEIVAR